MSVQATVPSKSDFRKVVIAGQGYVGLAIAMRAVEVGYDVVGYDIDTERVKRLLLGHSYVYDVSDAVLTAALDGGRYLPTAEESDCSEFDAAVITVPTPLRDGVPDLSYIEACGCALAPMLRPGATVMLESTTYPGTTDELLSRILEEGSGLRAGTDFYLGYSPERIDPGNGRWGLENTPKVVSGIDPGSLAQVERFYGSLVERTVAVSSTRVGELVKLFENTFRHVNIALVNEMAMFASALDIDVWEAISAASTKPFGFLEFRPGPGVGGHCLPIDPSYLSWKVMRTLGYPFRFVELANDVNDHMPDYVVRRVTAALNADRKSVNGARVLVLGIAYKPNSRDTREAPGPIICDLLAELGADVVACDPHLEEDQFPRSARSVTLTTEALTQADLVIVVTDHDAFDWDLISDRSRHVFDTRHRLAPAGNVEFL